MTGLVFLQRFRLILTHVRRVRNQFSHLFSVDLHIYSIYSTLYVDVNIQFWASVEMDWRRLRGGEWGREGGGEGGRGGGFFKQSAGYRWPD